MGTNASSNNIKSKKSESKPKPTQQQHQHQQQAQQQMPSGNDGDDDKNVSSRIDRLQAELDELRRRQNEDGNGCPPTMQPVVAPVTHKGYLFRYLDRTIGWGGTKWSLRFVSLNGGKIAYYGSHRDEDPRYVLSLRGCAVRDEGYKPNRRHRSNSDRTPPPLEEAGAYFHVFSIYQRNSSEKTNTAASKNGASGNNDDDDRTIMPLLRFSTPSLAEKTQWMMLIGQACQYGDTDEFLEAERAERVLEEERSLQHARMALAMPQAQKGTLPPLYFADHDAMKKKGTASSSGHKRRPSGSAASLYRTRTKSNDAERVDMGYPPSKPMHRGAAPSCLSEEASVQNYRGFFNLAIIILAISNARLILDTYEKHGLFINDMRTIFGNFLASTDKLHDFPIISGFAGMQMFVVAAFGIEWMLSRKRVPNLFGMMLHHINAHGMLIIYCWLVWTHIDLPVVGASLLFHAVILWMKLLSYALANEDYRLMPNSEESSTAMLESFVKDLDPEVTTYPQNVTMVNIFYFWFAPTLTYQIAFPRSPRIRVWKIATLVFRFILALCILLFLTAQVISPHLKELNRALEETDDKLTLDIMARYGLKLSIASTYCWLLVFYGYFHIYLNITAEILRFGDRVFYKDWWNSSDIGSYWRLWNIPVHYWLIRHAYFPCVRVGISKPLATLFVFFLSAVMHEVLISIPFHMIRPWAWLGMMGQIPLVWMTKYLTKRLPGTSLGNVIFWLSFCIVGQPIAILMYTIDYQYYQDTDRLMDLPDWLLRLGNIGRGEL